MRLWSGWSLALRELAATSPGSVSLLRLLACLAPEEIPFRLLLEGESRLPESVDAEVAERVGELRGDVFALDDAVARLRRHSLIGPPSRVVSVHRLVQAVTLDQLDEQAREAWQDAAAALVEAAIPEDITVRAAWPVCAALFPHAEAVLDQLSDGMRRLAEYLGHRGDYATARTVWSHLATAYGARLGREHPDTLTARENFAYWTGEAGDAVAARDLFRALLPVHEI